MTVPAPASISGSVLAVVNISKSFGAVRALADVSFEVHAGEVHALLGENGAGKSTLIKIMTGAHRPDGGVIEVGGAQLDHLSPATAHSHGIACIYQQPALFPTLTVAENIALRLEPVAPWRQVDWTQRTTRAAKLLERIGAAIDPGREVQDLSMPEQQLVEIACALGAKARFVIMDEPTASLTQKEQHLLFKVVRELRDVGVGIIYISHRLEEIFALADRVTVLRDGHSVGTFQREQLHEVQLINLMVGRSVEQVAVEPGKARGDAIISLRGLGSHAGAVHDVNLDVGAGEIVGLAGLVGAGRSELARTLFGLTPADSGEILFRGERIVVCSPQQAIGRGIAYVPEDRRRHGVILELPLAVNVAMAVQRRIFPGSWVRPAAERALAWEYMRDLGIKAAGPDAAVASLSGGNQQKVALARWLATKPQLLILDEPTQGVDVAAKAEIHKIIRQLVGQGIAVLLISSDLPEILTLSSRIAVMRHGTIVATFPAGTAAAQVMAAALGQPAAAAGKA